MQITQIWMLSFLTGIEPASVQNGGYVSGKQGTFTPLGCPTSPGSMW